MSNKFISGGVALLCLMLTTCRISYTFNQSTIDYSETRTISIAQFPNHATRVSPLLSSTLTEGLIDKFQKQTKLEIVPNNGDLEIEGEITGYNITPMDTREDALSSRDKLTITIRVRYFNKAHPEKDFEQTFSAFYDYDSNDMFDTIEDELNSTIVEELVDQIYNSTVADW